jgi:hypothetical protein
MSWPQWRYAFAQGVHGVVAGVDDVRLFAKDGVIDLDGELGGNVELPAQFADVGDPGRPDPGVAEIHLAGGRERETRVGQVLPCQGPEQVP